MKKSPYFLRLFAFLFAMGFAAAANAAGYSCPAYIKYTSCNSGYYLSDCGTTYDGRTLTTTAAGNSCAACPAGQVCDGGMKCPYAACTECSTITGYTLGGCLNDTNYCYFNETLYGSQLTPTCSVDSCTYGTCTVGSCSRKNYYGATDESCTPANCTKPFASFTVIAGTYWTGTAHSYCNGNEYYCPGETKTATSIGTSAWGRRSVDTGYYSTGGTATTRTGQTACTNIPSGVNQYNSFSYTGHGGGMNSCPWSAKLNSGYYWTGGAIADCPAGSYCPGGATFTASSGETGRTSCSTATGNRFPNSAVRSSVITQCYTTRTATCSRTTTTTPNGCASHTYNTCTCTGSTYIQYSDVSGIGNGTTSGTTIDYCTNTVATVTANAGNYVSGTTCPTCTSKNAAYPNSDGGNIAATKCYSGNLSRQWTGSQTPCATPGGCASRTCNTCSNPACNYVAYADGTVKSGCSTNNAACQQTVASVTASANYYVNGITCPACTSVSTIYPRSDGGNITSNACYTTCAPGTYLSGSSCLPCTGGNYCDGSKAYYGVTGSNGMNMCPAGYDAGGAGLELKNQCRMICTGGTIQHGIYTSNESSVTYNTQCTYTAHCDTGYHSAGTAWMPGCGRDVATLQFNAPDSTSGSVPANVTCTFNGTCTIPNGNNLAKTTGGDIYAFNGWCTGQNGAGTCYSQNDNANTLVAGKNGQAIQLYARWTQTVMYCAAGTYYNGASCVPCTVRNYCTGVNANVGGGVQGLASCADLTPYDTWTNSPASATINTACFATCSEHTITNGTAIPTNNATSANYPNICTYAATCNTGYSPNPAKQDTATPECVANTFTIYLNGNSYVNNPTNGTMAQVNCTYGQPCSLPMNTYTKANYHFVGWSEDSGNPPTSEFTQIVGDSSGLNTILNGSNMRDYLTGGSVTLYAIWEIDTKTCAPGSYLNIDACEICPLDNYCTGITRQIDGGVHGKSSCASLDAGVGKWGDTSSTGATSSDDCYTTCLPAPTAIAHGFLTHTNPTEAYPNTCTYTASCSTGYQPVNDMTENPVCEANMFDISFDGNGASSGSMATKTCYVGQTCYLPAFNDSFIRTGFMFTRWAVGSLTSTDYFNDGVNINGLTPLLDTDVTMYAKWEKCNGGYTWNGTTCSICPIGKWNAAGDNASGAASLCENCGGGMTTDNPGTSSASGCKLCPVGSYCGTTGGPAIACDTNWPETIAGAQTEDECFKQCLDYPVTNGTAKAKNQTENYPTECDYYCVSDSGNIGEVRNGVCVETQCANTMEMVNGACQSCNRENALSYKKNGNCEIETCTTGYHPDGQQCRENVVACDAPNAIEATMTWDFSLKAFGSCIIKICESGYHLSANACVLDEQPCTVENGIGYKEWNSAKGKWGDCIVSSCNPGYTSDKSETNQHTKLCGECKNKYSVLGQQAASSYVRECEIASCMYQGELYTLDNNECLPICDLNGYEDETGSLKWNSSTKKCERQCKAGYSMW